VSDELMDEVGAEGNRVVAARSKAVAEYVAKELADLPEAVEVDVVEGGRQTTLLLHADSSDMGRIIGRRGRTIQALRQIVRAAGASEGEDVTIDTAD
jgi:predicted RNA-binding protein YlqC (UPF0109 family)